MQISLTTFRQILKSRVVEKKRRNEPYVIERRAICNLCEFNTKNKKNKTIKDVFKEILNGLTPTCSLCGCGIKFKTVIPEAECGLFDVGKDPKW